jgi:hypothetical protein
MMGTGETTRNRGRTETATRERNRTGGRTGGDMKGPRGPGVEGGPGVDERGVGRPLRGDWEARGHGEGSGKMGQATERPM